MVQRQRHRAAVLDVHNKRIILIDATDDQMSLAGGDNNVLHLTNLCGPEGWVKERIAAFKEAGVGTLNLTPIGPDATDTIEKIKAWSE